MRRILMLLGYLMCFVTGKAQQTEIIYHFPSAVVDHIQHYLNGQEKAGKYYFADIDTRTDTVELVLRSFKMVPGIDTFSVFQLVHASNRYLQLDSQKLPLIFFADLLFSGLTHKKISENRYQHITLGGSGGLYIKFIGRPWTQNMILEVEY